MVKTERVRSGFLCAITLALLAVGVVPQLEAEGLLIQGHLAIAPRSIPVPESGIASFAVTRLQFRNKDNFDTNTSISRIDYQVTKSGALSYADIVSVKAYFEPQGGAGTYDNGRPSGDDLDIMTGSSYNNTTGAGYVTLNAAAPQNSFGWGASTHIFVVLEIQSTADYASTAGCEITAVTYGAVGSGTGGTGSPQAPAAHNTSDNLDKYRVNLTASGVAPVSGNQGGNNVPVLKLALTTIDASAADIDLDRIRVHSLGDSDADIAAAGVLLYLDDGDGVFEPGGDDGAALASGTLGGGYATLDPPVDPVFTPLVTKTFWVAVNVAITAVIGNTIELEVENPSSDFTFKDIIQDDNVGIPADYAYVFLGYPYLQRGYLTGTSATPTTLNSFTVTPAPDMSNPSVLSTNPSPGAVVNPDKLIEIIFSQYMLESAVGGGVLNPANYELRNLVNDTTIAVTPAYSNQKVTLTPASALDWATAYRVTLDQAIEDIDGQTLFDQYGGDYQFVFSVRPEYPEVSAPTVIKNRIGTGADSEAVILIPTPPKGASEKMSVQAFTTTGRLVKTFCRNVPYSSITNGRYLWDGTNDRGEELGPGMYFIQVRSESYKRVLKVMIVR